MDILKEFISYLLIEDRISDAKAKYPNLAQTIDSLAAQDPSGNQKYLMWIAKQVDAQYGPKTTMDAVKKFHQLSSRMEKKDINQYKNLEELLDALERTPEVSKRKQKISISDQAEKIYDDGRFLVLNPRSQQSTCHYGKGTQWCIAATTSRNYFDDYSKQNIEFFFVFDRTLPEDSPNHKIAIAYYRDSNNVEAFDATDDLLLISELYQIFDKSYDSIFQAIKNSLAKTSASPGHLEKQKEFDKKAEELITGTITADDYFDFLNDRFDDWKKRMKMMVDVLSQLDRKRLQEELLKSHRLSPHIVTDVINKNLNKFDEGFTVKYIQKCADLSSDYDVIDVIKYLYEHFHNDEVNREILVLIARKPKFEYSFRDWLNKQEDIIRFDLGYFEKDPSMDFLLMPLVKLYKYFQKEPEKARKILLLSLNESLENRSFWALTSLLEAKLISLDDLPFTEFTGSSNFGVNIKFTIDKAVVTVDQHLEAFSDMNPSFEQYKISENSYAIPYEVTHMFRIEP